MYVLGKGARPAEPEDLEGYATARGLTWSREAALRHYGALFGAEKGENFNTMRGVLPGGAFGVMGHRVTGVRERGGADHQMRRSFEAATFAAAFVPESRATLSAVEARQCRCYVDYEHGIALEEVADEHGWTIGSSPRTNPEALAAVWSGEIGQWVRSAYPGGRLDVRAGIASLWLPHYVMDPAALDALGQGITWAAGAIAAVCARFTSPAAWDAVLTAPPVWDAPGTRSDDLARAIDDAGGRVRYDSAGIDAHVFDPGATTENVYSGVRDFAASYAGARRLVLEDARTFDLAYPMLPFPGWTQCVWRGALSDGTVHRLALSAQRPLSRTNPGIVSGAIVAIARALPGAPDQPLEWDPTRKLWTAALGGLRLVWTTYRNLEVTHAVLDDVVAELGR
jgi:hypothetical protein